MAEEVGVAFVRLVPSMRGFGPEATNALNDAAAGPADAAGEEAGGRFSGAFGAALAAGGALAVGALVAGVGEALDQGKITAKLGAQLGATPAEAKKYGELAGDLYAGAIVTDFQQGADTIRAVMSSGLVPPDATNAQIQSIATNAADLANTFDVDLSAAANAAGGMLKNGLAKNGQEAFDLLTAGMTGIGPASDDLLETFTEYGPIFQSAGISGQTAMGLIKQAIQGGWVKDTDKIGDAFKELNLRATEGSKGVVTAFETLGLNAKQTGDDIAAGGERGEKAMDQVLTSLNKLGPNSQEAKQIVSTLFGGPGEDLGAALFKLNVGEASKAMDGAAGSAKALGDGLRDNAGAQVTAFKNALQQGFVEFLGTHVIPALTTFIGFLSEHQTELKAFATVVTAVVVPALVVLGGKAMWAGIQMARAWIVGLGPVAWAVAAIAAVVVLVIAYWDEIKAATLAAWTWIVGKVMWAKDGILGAVGWLATIPGKVSAWFGSAKNAALAKMSSLVAWLRGLPGRIGSAIGSLGGTLANAASSGFQRFRNAAAEKVSSFIAFVRSIPGRARSALGSLGGLLWDAGKSLIMGLVNGIKSAFGSVKSTLSDLTSKLTSWKGPESVDKKILTPAGRMVIAGFQQGLADQTPALRSQLQQLTGDVPGMAVNGLGSARSGAAAAAAPTVVIDAGNLPRALAEWLRNAIRVEAGGSAERYFKAAG